MDEILSNAGEPEAAVFVAKVGAAGELAAVTDGKLGNLDSLVVEGPVNAADFDTMWRLAFEGKVAAINLEKAAVEDGKVPDRAFFRQEQNIDGVFHILPLRSVVFGESVREIGDFAFSENYELKYVTLPASLRKLGKSSFYRTIIRDVELPDGIEEIPEWCFGSCSMLVRATLPETLKTIGSNAFQGDVRLAEVNFPASLSEIGDGAFMGCRLRNVELPPACAGVRGQYAFRSNYELTRLSLPDGMREVPAEFACNAMSLTDLSLPESVWIIGKEAFQNCSSLRSLEFPEGFEALEEGAFDGCAALEEIVMPSTTKYLGQHSFFNLGKLKRIYCKAVLPPWGAPKYVNGGEASADVTLPEGVFGTLSGGASSTPRYVEIFVPVGSAGEYRAAWGWNYFTNFIETDFDQAGAGITSAGEPGVEIRAEKSVIVIDASGVMPYSVCAPNGRVMAGGTLSGGVANIPVTPGLYVVNAGGITAKVAVR